MTRGARIAGWSVFAAATAGASFIAAGLLSIRSPLADGSVAPGPEPAAYVVVAVAVLAGAAVAGLVAAGIAEIIVRSARR